MKAVVVASVLGFAALGVGQNYPDTPEHAWAFGTVSEFTRCELWPTPLVMQITHGPRPPDRYECAISVHMNILKMRKTLDDRLLAGKKGSWLIPRDGAFIRLRRLVDTFSKELGVMGVKVTPLRQEVEEARRTAASLRRQSPKLVIGVAKKWVPDIPENHWIYNLFDSARQRGLMKRGELPIYRGLYTSKELARALAMLVPRITAYPKRPAVTKDGYRTLGYQELLFQLQRMCRFLEPELTAQHVSATRLLSKVLAAEGKPEGG